ncbi:hypothetical protein ACKI1O_51445, partial [Streptomyces scabiei]
MLEDLLGLTFEEATRRFDWPQVYAELGWFDLSKIDLAHTIVDRHVARTNPALLFVDRNGSTQSVSFNDLADA